MTRTAQVAKIWLDNPLPAENLRTLQPLQPRPQLAEAGKLLAPLLRNAADQLNARPRPASGPILGPDLPRPLTGVEAQLDRQIRQRVAPGSEARGAYALMLGRPLFAPGRTDSAAASARRALLEQVKAQPEAGVILNLVRLGETRWFIRQTPADQQRSAKLVAYASSGFAPGGANPTRLNTLDQLLAPGMPQLRWADLSVMAGSVPHNLSEIVLDRKQVPAGPAPIGPQDRAAVKMATESLPHEMNHILHGGGGTPFRLFTAEYRAYYVGMQAQHGRAPTAYEAWTAVNKLIGPANGGYKSLKAAVADPASPDGQRMIAFAAGVMGLDPASATLAQIRNPANIRADKSVLTPIPSYPLGPNNLTNTR